VDTVEPDASRAVPEHGAALCCGDLRVEPASREIAGPGGGASLEPRVLRVLLALMARAGEVVGREDLLAQCWPGMVVGEDSLNRAIAALRKALRATGSELVLQTISKSGYRLQRPAACAPAAAPGGPADAPAPSTPRRELLVASLAAVATGAGGWIWWRPSPDDRQRAALLVEHASLLLRDERWGAVDPEPLLREAIRLDRRDARAWGLLAIAQRDLALSSSELPEFQALAECQLAAGEALALDATQPEALVALATVESSHLRWLQAERQLVPLVARFPDNEHVLRAMAELLHQTGRAGEQASLRRRLAALHPSSARYASELVTTLWLSGETAEMDRMAEEAMKRWPGYGLAWLARLETFAFTGRAKEALDMIDRRGDPGEHPPLIGEALVAMLRALTKRASTEEAIAAVLAAGARRQSSACLAIPMLAALGAIDPAFALAEGYLLGRGALKVPYRFGASQPGPKEMQSRYTSTLFYPSARSLWPDPRFAGLCREVGLMAYWRASGTRPDLLGSRPFET
jgi:DNA-binding winged helix-turn-helix (wHTH) protein